MWMLWKKRMTRGAFLYLRHEALRPAPAQVRADLRHCAGGQKAFDHLAYRVRGKVCAEEMCGQEEHGQGARLLLTPRATHQPAYPSASEMFLRS